jgi:hypothetical protein
MVYKLLTVLGKEAQFKKSVPGASGLGTLFSFCRIKQIPVSLQQKLQSIMTSVGSYNNGIVRSCK